MVATLTSTTHELNFSITSIIIRIEIPKSKEYIFVKIFQNAERLFCTPCKLKVQTPICPFNLQHYRFAISWRQRTVSTTAPASHDAWNILGKFHDWESFWWTPQVSFSWDDSDLKIIELYNVVVKLKITLCYQTNSESSPNLSTISNCKRFCLQSLCLLAKNLESNAKIFVKCPVPDLKSGTETVSFFDFKCRGSCYYLW